MHHKLKLYISRVLSSSSFFQKKCYSNKSSSATLFIQVGVASFHYRFFFLRTVKAAQSLFAHPGNQQLGSLDHNAWPRIFEMKPITSTPDPTTSTYSSLFLQRQSAPIYVLPFIVKEAVSQLHLHFFDTPTFYDSISRNICCSSNRAPSIRKVLCDLEFNFVHESSSQLQFSTFCLHLFLELYCNSNCDSGLPSYSFRPWLMT